MWSMEIYDAQIVSKMNEDVSIKNFDEDINHLLRRRNMYRVREAWVVFFTNYVIVKHSLMEKGLRVICNASSLSQKSSTGRQWKTRTSCTNYLSQTNSQVVVAMTRYSTSAEEWETTICFLVFKEMGLSLNRIKKPVVECQVVGQLPNGVIKG